MNYYNFFLAVLIDETIKAKISLDSLINLIIFYFSNAHISRISSKK